MTITMQTIRNMSETNRDAAQMLANEFHTDNLNQSWTNQRIGYHSTVVSRIKRRIQHNGGAVRGMESTSIY